MFTIDDKRPISITNTRSSEHPPSGSLHLILGPMFSGKTSYLMTMYRRYQLAGMNVLLIKYKGDCRYSNTEHLLITHDQQSLTAYSLSKLGHLDISLDTYDVILIDEIQFYPDATFYCDKWANQGKVVIVSGLSGDYQRKPFKVISELIPKVDNITHVKAICLKSGRDAPFTMRTVDTKKKKLIGGQESYMAVHRSCFPHDKEENSNED